RSACSTRWSSCRSCRIGFDASPSSNSESWSEARTEPAGLGSHHRRSLHFADAARAGPAVRHRPEAIHSAAFSQALDQAKVPTAVFTQTRPTTRTERTEVRTDRSGH